MKIFFILFIAITLGLLNLSGCGEQKSGNGSLSENKTENKKTTSNTASDIITFSPKEFYRSVNGCKDSDSCTYFKITYIEAVSGKIKEKLNAFIGKEVLAGAAFYEGSPATIEAAADTFMTSYKDAKKEFPDMPGGWAWEYNLKVYSETPKILCLTSDAYTNTGGAHPNSFTAFYNISKETGDTLSLANLLSPGFETKLNELIDKKYRQMKGLKPTDKLSDKGDLFVNKISFNYNVAITKEGGLEFYYNPYEIAAYAVGPITITLSRSELGSLIGEGSLL